MEAWIWGARLSWVAMMVLTGVFIGYASVHGTAEDMADYGGLSSCFKCANGWNWHVLLCTMGFPVAMTESVLAIRAPLCGMRGSKRKWAHATWLTASVGLNTAGMIAIVQSKQWGSYAMMYSVHSWTGAVVLFLFALQLIMGWCLVLVLPRVSYLPNLYSAHRFLGKISFIAGIGVCVNGMADMQMMNVDSGQPAYGSATLVGSAYTIALWLLLGCMMYVMFGTSYQRGLPKSGAKNSDVQDTPPHSVPNKIDMITA